MELTLDAIKERIYLVRGQQVVLDEDLANFYQTKTGNLNQAVQRNIGRFPSDFTFKLTEMEDKSLKSQSSYLGAKHGGRRYFPRAFTEHGVAMLSSVLKNDRAIQVNILIMRSFAQVRLVNRNEAEPSLYLKRFEEKLDNLDGKVEGLFRTVLLEVKNLSTATSAGSLVSMDNQSSLGLENQTGLCDPINAVEARHNRSEPRRPIDSKRTTICRTVASHFGLTEKDLSSATRARAIVVPRQIAIYLIRKHLGSPFKEIGTHFGIKDHTTVIHAVRKISDAVARGGSIQEGVSAIQILLRQSGSQNL